jgi:hypothetical protein
VIKENRFDELKTIDQVAHALFGIGQPTNLVDEAVGDAAAT